MDFTTPQRSYELPGFFLYLQALPVLYIDLCTVRYLRSGGSIGSSSLAARLLNPEAGSSL
eukprot:3859837-Pleurochrysis_carterae.AAC.2